MTIVSSTAGFGWPLRLEAIRDLLATDTFEEGAAWFKANPQQGNAYNFSKEVSTVYTMSMGLAVVEMGFRINAVLPGPVETPILVDFEESMGKDTLDGSRSSSAGTPIPATSPTRCCSWPPTRPGGSTATRSSSTAASPAPSSPVSFRHQRSEAGRVHRRRSLTQRGAPRSARRVRSTCPGIRRVFATGRTRELGWRLAQLEGIERLCDEREADIAAALHADLGRPAVEAWLGDIASTKGEAAYARKHLKKWMRRRQSSHCRWRSCRAAAGCSTTRSASF